MPEWLLLFKGMLAVQLIPLGRREGMLACLGGGVGRQDLLPPPDIRPSGGAIDEQPRTAEW